MLTNTSTPWGMSQTFKQIAPGVIRYDTASHGGYHVDLERLLQMPEPLRSFTPWAGANWYEEDCDWCIVALAFPQLFPTEYLPDAMATLERYQPELFERFKAWKKTQKE